MAPASVFPVYVDPNVAVETRVVEHQSGVLQIRHPGHAVPVLVGDVQCEQRSVHKRVRAHPHEIVPQTVEGDVVRVARSLAARELCNICLLIFL